MVYLERHYPEDERLEELRGEDRFKMDSVPGRGEQLFMQSKRKKGG